MLQGAAVVFAWSSLAAIDQDPSAAYYAHYLCFMLSFSLGLEAPNA